MVGLKERSRVPQYTDCPSSNKSSSGPAALHYLRHHCSSACTDLLKRFYEVWLPVLRKHEDSRGNRWTHFAQRLQKIHFPLLRKLQPNKFFTWVAGIFYFFLIFCDYGQTSGSWTMTRCLVKCVSAMSCPWHDPSISGDPLLHGSLEVS